MWKKKFNGASGAEHQDVYTRVTNRIIADLEKGVRPWVKPWNADNAEGRITRPLRHDGTPYRGINVLMLWSAGLEKGYDQPTWMTFRQALELEANVRKGERGSLVVYANTFHKTEHTEQGDVEKDIPFLKGYTVFNVSQIEGLPEKYYAKPPPKFESKVERIEHAEEFIRNTGAKIFYGGPWARYSKTADDIRVPHPETFIDMEKYYATVLHELSHWTGHPSRLDRDFGRKKWGDEGYAMEELTAEISAVFACTDLEIVSEPPEENTAYIGNWIQVLKSDTKAIFTAASHGQKSVEHLHSLQPRELEPSHQIDVNPALS